MNTKANQSFKKLIEITNAGWALSTTSNGYILATKGNSIFTAKGAIALYNILKGKL